MSLIPLVLTVALGAPAPATPAPDTVAGPVGRRALPTWTYAEDVAGTGELAGWPTGRFAGREVRVPDVANPARPGTVAAKVAYRGSAGWYRRTLSVRGGSYVLRFESVASRAAVWVDGVARATHARAYEPFEVPLRLGGGRHVVVVRADWRSPASQTAQGLHRTWFNWGGIDREVTIRRVGRSSVDRVTATTQLAGGRALVHVGARVRNLSGSARRVPVFARLQRDGRAVTVRLGSPRLAPGASRVLRRTLVVVRPALWEPGRGRLYDLTVSVPLESSTTARVGLREVAWAGGVLRINGRKAVLRGASIQEDVPGHGDALAPRDMDAVVARLRRIGATATRAQHALSPGLLQRLDAAGIAVWQQIGPVDSPGEFASGRTPAGVTRARAQARSDVAAMRLHPSIVTWSLACEVDGDGAPGQAEYVDAMASELHRTDPGRGVAVDVWTGHEPAVAGLLYRSLDAVGVTSYFGWYEDTFASFPRQAALVRARVRGLRSLFPGRGVVVAELGAEGTPGNPAAQRGGTGYQSRLLAAQLGALRTAPGLDGAFVWVLRDFSVNPAFDGGSIVRIDPRVRLLRGLNQKGLFDYDGRAKPAVRVVARALRRFG